jgi:hypothetical protein
MKLSKILITIFLFLFFSSGSFCQQKVDLSKDLFYYYPFNKSLKDASGKTDGSTNNAMFAPDRFGNANSSYYCNGSNPVVITPIDVSKLDRLTLSVWVRLQRDDKAMNIVSFGYGNAGRGISVIKKNGSYYFAASAGENGMQASVMKAVKDAWVLVAAEYDRTSKDLLFYIKTAKGSTVIGGKADFSELSNTIFVGGNDTSQSFGFDGYLDDLRIYGRRLTEKEIICLFENCQPEPRKEPVGGGDDPEPGGVIIPRKTDKCDSSSLELGALTCSNADIFCVDPNTKYSFNVPPLECADHYEWVLSDGISGSSSSEKISVSLTDTNNTAEIKVRAVHKLRKGPFSTKSITIQQRPVFKNISITGPGTICSYLENYKYKLSKKVKGAEINWILPENCSMIEQKDDYAILKFTEKFSSGEIKVFGKNGCGSSADTAKLEVIYTGPLLVNNKYTGPDKGKQMQNAEYSVKGCFKNSESYSIRTTPGIYMMSQPISVKLPHNYREDFKVRFTTKFNKDTIFVKGYNEECGEGPQTLVIVVTKEENKTPKKEEPKETPSGTSFSKALNKKIVGFALSFSAFGKVEKEGPTFQNNEYAKMEEDGYVGNGEESSNFLAGIHKDVKVAFQGNAFTCSYTVGKSSPDGDSGVLTISGHISADGKMLQDCAVNFVGQPGTSNYRKSDYHYSFEVRDIPADIDQSQWNKHYVLNNINQISTIFTGISYFKKQYDGDNYTSEKLISYDPNNNANSFSLYFYYTK